MYLKFTRPIGKSAKGKYLNAICLQCARVSRARDTKAKKTSSKYGYKVHMHGYPIAESEIAKTFSGMNIMVDNVPVFDNSDS